MTRLANPAERSTFTADSKGQFLLAGYGQRHKSSSNPMWDLPACGRQSGSYAVFTSEDWRSPFRQYLTKGILPQKHSERYKLKRLATRYFLHNEVLFKKRYDGDPLRCLGPDEAKEMIKEMHSGECGEHQGKKQLYRCLLQMGYYWPTMKKDATEFVKRCHNCQVQADLIHIHLQNLHNMVTPWPFYT